MSSNRRKFLRTALIGAGAFEASEVMTSAASRSSASSRQRAVGAETRDRGSRPIPASPVPVQSLDVPKLSWHWENGAKVFHLVAEPVQREFLPGHTFDLWGYNGCCPGPTLEVNQGDRVRIIVDNHLPEATSMHWHGLEIPIAMDGMPAISQPLIQPGERFIYEFTLHQNGTFFYHSHMAMQEMMGLMGLFILQPREAYTPPVDKDFGIVLQEWAILPNSTIPNTMSMEFNWLTMNGKVGPAAAPLIIRLGDRVRIRLVNMGMDHHPIHLHGNTFHITGTEAGRIPESAWMPGNTVLVGVAQARDIEFVANHPGDWMLHCHLPHHMMNHMASLVGPMTGLGRGMPAGLGMEEGMGMLRPSGATSVENGPSLGRSMGIGSDYEAQVSNMTQPASSGMAGTTGVQHRASAKNPESVPGYPQDMFMPMDNAVESPATYGLPPGWSGAVMGMMTLVRVLPPPLYDKVMAMMKERDAG
ncbi:MAG: multicopper oxidase family protein [Terriglobia bacterium]